MLVLVRFVDRPGGSNATFDHHKPQGSETSSTTRVITSPLWFPEATLFLSPHQYEAWQDLAWKGIVLQLLMYAGIELCVRMECRGAD